MSTMEASQPKWINKEFLKMALLGKNMNPTDINIKHYNVASPVEPGNNHCSILYRVKVEFEIKNQETLFKSFMVKAPLVVENFVQKLVEDSKLQQNEHSFYMNILPKMLDISKHEFGPKVYECKREDILVMEDLKESGLTMCDRLEQMDYSHCKQAVVTLARFHATTVALYNKYPELVESNGNEPMYNHVVLKENNLYDACTLTMTAIANIIKDYDELAALSEAIRRHSGSLLKSVEDLFNQKRKFSVLNHGDFWTNNILFKHEDGNVRDCKLIDFQLRRFGSPAIDLWYFILTSPKPEIRTNRVNELFDIYLNNLNETLVQLGCSETFNLSDLQEELRNFLPWALITAICYLPFILNDYTYHSEYILGLKDVNVEEHIYLKLLLGKTFLERLPGVCNQLVSFGLLEYLTMEDCQHNIS